MSLDHFEYANTVRGIAQRIAFQLNDAEAGWEYSRWDEQWIIAKLRDIFKWFQSKDPSLFATEVSITLQPGSKQHRPEGCDKLLDILCLEGPTGEQIPVLRTKYKNIRTSSVYDKLYPRCMYDGCAYHIAINPSNREEFLISPPVLASDQMTVTALCSDTKEFFEDIDKELDCEISEYITLAVDWVLSQALAMDGLTPTLQQAAGFHLNAFNNALPERFAERGSNDTDVRA